LGAPYAQCSKRNCALRVRICTFVLVKNVDYLSTSPARKSVVPHLPAYDSIRQQTSAYVSIRQHTSAYVSIRQHTSAFVSIRQHTSAYVSIRQHTSADVSRRQQTSAYVSIRQHTQHIPRAEVSSSAPPARMLSAQVLCVHHNRRVIRSGS
jgi:hypothetical protein